jgi:hypothetical protein
VREVALWVKAATRAVADFIADQRTCHGVPQAVTCRALAVSPSWFHKWHGRTPTARQSRRAELCERVRKLFEASGKTYGSLRIRQDLVDEGWAVNDLCARLGVVPSMGGVASALGNVVSESFNSVLKVESAGTARHTRRHHSAAGGPPLLEFERVMQERRATGLKAHAA